MTLRGVAVALVLLTLGSTACGSRPRVVVAEGTYDWTQIGATPEHSGWSVPGPTPPLEFAWTFEGEPAPANSALGPLEEGDRRVPFEPPVASGDRVLIQSDRIYAVDTGGSLVWSFGTGQEDEVLSPPVLVPPVAVVARLLASSDSLEVAALDLSDGQPLWTYSTPVGPATGPVLAASRDLVVVATQGRRPEGLILRTGDGSELAHLELTISPTQAPVVGDGAAIFVSNKGMEAIELPSGSRVWRKDVVVNDTAGQAALVGDTIVLATEGTDAGFGALSAYAVTTGAHVSSHDFRWGVYQFVVTPEMVIVETAGPGSEREAGKSDEVHDSATSPTTLLHEIQTFGIEDLWDVRETLPLPESTNRLYYGFLQLPNGFLVMSEQQVTPRFESELILVGSGGSVLWRGQLPLQEPKLLGSSKPTGIASNGSTIFITTGSGQLHAFVPSAA